MRRKKQVALQDIASELQLTVHTVSKALRGLPGMSEATRREIFEVARKLGYKTKEQELSLGYEKIPLLSTKRRRFTMLFSYSTPFLRLQLEGIQDRLHEMGHSVAVSFISKGAYEQDGFQSWVELENLMYSDGLFIPPAIPDSLEAQLLQLPLPKVMINYPPPLAAVDSVIWDVIGAIHQAVEHFVSMGHRRILYIGDIYKFRGFQLRWQAFEEAMKWHGSVMVPEEHLTSSYSHSELWMNDLKDKLSQGQFTAILCAVDHDLAKIFYVVNSLQLSIPDDISLISLADMENPLFPQVTRPLLLVKEGGQRAAERLLWRIANPNLPYEHIRLQGGFYNGSTVKRIK